MEERHVHIDNYYMKANALGQKLEYKVLYKRKSLLRVTKEIASEPELEE